MTTPQTSPETPTISREEVLDFANRNLVGWMATVDGTQPRVRGLLMWFADETGFYFHTGTMKCLADQLQANPRVEVAFHDPGTGPHDSRMLRVAGITERVEDEALIQRLKEERSFLKDMVQAIVDGELYLFRIYTGEAHFWTNAVNLREREQPRWRF